jgi:2,3,4,5-tetrahydropyridine-2-carboxylate N-succinyltransferase
MSQLVTLINEAFENRAQLSPETAPSEVKNAVNEALQLLDSGQARVAEKVDGQWVVHEWLKKAVLLSFRLNDNHPIEAGFTQFYDKVPSKFNGLNGV